MKCLFVLFGLAFSISCNGQEICSGIDISNEKQFSFEEMSGLWYVHFLEDNTPFATITPGDAKFFFLPVGNILLKYFFGRPKNGTGCITAIFLDKQRARSPCFIVQLASPVLGDPTEFVYTFLPGKDKMVVAFCGDPECTIHAVGGFTRRKRLCSGEREMFNSKLRQLGIPVTFRRQNRSRPASNDCTVPGIERIDQGKTYSTTCKRLRKSRRY